MNGEVKVSVMQNGWKWNREKDRKKREKIKEICIKEKKVEN